LCPDDKLVGDGGLMFLGEKIEGGVDSFLQGCYQHVVIVVDM